MSYVNHVNFIEILRTFLLGHPVQVSKTIIQVTSAYLQVKCVQCIPNFSGFLYTRSTVIYIEVLLYVCNLFIFWCIYSSTSVHRSSWDVYIIIISIHRCLQIILKLPITQLPEVLRYKFQNILECILVQSQFLVVQHPFLGTLHPYTGIHKQSPVVKILYTSIIHIIKSQLQSNTLKQSSVKMDAATIIMLVTCKSVILYKVL